MNIKNIHQLIEEKTSEFVQSMNYRFSSHVSDEFIQSYIVGEFTSRFKNNPDKPLVDLAYQSCIYLFESLLEHGCNVSVNGHHIAQSFSEYFNNISIEYEKKNIIEEIKKSVIKYVKHDYYGEGEFWLSDWFRFFLSGIKLRNWVKVPEENGGLESLSCENISVLEFTEKYLLFTAGGDWQNPHQVKLFYCEDEIYEVSDQGEGYESGLSEKEFCHILKLDFNEDENLINLSE